MDKKYFGQAKDKNGNVGYTLKEDNKKKVTAWIDRMRSTHGVTRVEVFKENKDGLIVYESKMVWEVDNNTDDLF